jgi:hypothetical protein
MTLRMVEEGFDSEGGIRWYLVGEVWQHNYEKRFETFCTLALYCKPFA